MNLTTPRFISRLQCIPAVMLTLAVSLPALAQNHIALTEAERQRLGIVTAQVDVANNTNGVRVSATVISSPLHAGNLTALYEGIIERWLVPAGSQVSAGTALVEIRSPSLLTLQQDWMQASIDAEQARFEQSKDRQLFDEGVISRRRLEQTERMYRNAQFALDATSAALQSAGFNQNARQALNDSGTGLGLLRISAMTDGVLSRRIKEAGEHVEPGMLIGEVSASGQNWVEFNAPVAFLRRLETDQTLSLGSGDQVVIRLMDTSADPSTQTFAVHAELENDSVLRPGEIVNVVLADSASGVWIPGSAVVHNDHDTVVYVNSAEGVSARTLELLPSGSGYIATEGIRAGEEVVVQGTSVLKGMSLGLGGE